MNIGAGRVIAGCRIVDIVIILDSDIDQLDGGDGARAGGLLHGSGFEDARMQGPD